MVIYLVNIALILFWSAILMNDNSNKINKKLYCGIVAAQWTLISGLRSLSVGADTYAYKYYFDQAKSISWKSVFTRGVEYFSNSSEVAKDPGYVLFEKICQIFSGNYHVFLLIIGALFSISLSVWVYKNSKMPCLSFIIYSTLFYSFFAITGHRQTIATALIVLIGYEFIKQRKLAKFLIVSFISCLIHKSALVFIPFYFLANKKITRGYTFTSLTTIAIITILGKRIYAPIVELVGYASERLEYNKYSAGTYALVLLIVCLGVLIFYPFYKDKTNYPNHIFNITLLTLLSDLAVFYSQGFMRIQQYYSLFIMISIPEVLSCLGPKTKKIGPIVSIVVLILYLVKNNPKYSFFF